VSYTEQLDEYLRWADETCIQNFSDEPLPKLLLGNRIRLMQNEFYEDNYVDKIKSKKIKLSFKRPWRPIVL
jgi:hypothetical protein